MFYWYNGTNNRAFLKLKLSGEKTWILNIHFVAPLHLHMQHFITEHNVASRMFPDVFCVSPW
jgi:hypothetical protein